MAFALPTALALSGCRAEGDLPPRYRSLRVPQDDLASAAARERGRRLFLENCALCHGIRADGRGERREGLSKPPRDFTDPTAREKSSPRKMFFAIREGMQGTSMPAWKTLDEQQTWDLVAYLRSVARELK